LESSTEVEEKKEIVVFLSNARNASQDMTRDKNIHGWTQKPGKNCKQATWKLCVHVTSLTKVL